MSHCTFTEKLNELQGTLKLNMRFYNRILRLQRPPITIAMHIILYMLAAWLQMHPYLNGIYKRLGLHVVSDTLTCTLHVYKPTVCPAASCSLFLDIQEGTLLLGSWENTTCLYIQISSTPQPRYIFQQYLYHTYVCMHVQWNVKEALRLC